MIMPESGGRFGWLQEGAVVQVAFDLHNDNRVKSVLFHPWQAVNTRNPRRWIVSSSGSCARTRRWKHAKGPVPESAQRYPCMGMRRMKEARQTRVSFERRRGPVLARQAATRSVSNSGFGHVPDGWSIELGGAPVLGGRPRTMSSQLRVQPERPT